MEAVDGGASADDVIDAPHDLVLRGFVTVVSEWFKLGSVVLEPVLEGLELLEEGVELVVVLDVGERLPLPREELGFHVQ